MAQHTPGPITLDYEPTGFGGGKLLIDGEHGAELIGTMNGQGGYNYGHELVIRHNAYPAMVEALRDLVGQGDNGNYCDRCDSSLAEGHAEGCPIRAGEAALGAAEGLGDTHS